MILKRLVVRSETTDPYKNLALEQALMTLKDTAVLYLWQNDNTVVIGRNQDAFAECRVEEFLAAGGKIARRRTGGGAVYHDLGNLNYTLILPPEDFDIAAQMGTVSRALESLGVPDVAWNGRNDLITMGRKCSGNAFQMTKTAGCHHGTILINTDSTVLSRFLTPEKSKLLKHGIQSVSSRVVNLDTIVPGLTVESVCSALTAAFRAKYGETEPLSPKELNPEQIQKEAAFLQSAGWLYPERGDAPIVKEEHFPWGSFRACLGMNNGKITRAVFFTDALDAAFFPKAAELLTGHSPEEAGMLLNTSYPDASPEQKQIIADICACINQ